MTNIAPKVPKNINQRDKLMLGSGAWQTRKRKLSVFIAHIYGFIVHHIAHEADNYTVKYELGNQLRSLGKSFHELVMVCSHDGISSFHTHFDLFNPALYTTVYGSSELCFLICFQAIFSLTIAWKPHNKETLK